MTCDSDHWMRLTNVFRFTLDNEELILTPETTAQTVEGWDSITHIMLMVAVEKEFAIRFNTSELAGLKNVGELAQLIELRTTSRKYQ